MQVLVIATFNFNDCVPFHLQYPLFYYTKMNFYPSPGSLFLTLALFISQMPLSAQSAETGSSHNLFILDKLDDDSALVYRANLVTREGFSDLFFGYVDANYRRKVTGPWSVEVGYRHAFLKLGEHWREEYRPMLSLYWRGKLWDGNFSNRHRLEFRYFEGDAKDRIRYRNESVWKSHNKITAYQLTPFVEEEFFIDLTGNELNTNWLTFGISRSWAKGKKWKLGYRLQSQKFNGEWENRHTLVTGISLFY